MTSEPDSKPGRRAPTIELKATEVGEPVAPQNPGAAEPDSDRGAKAASERPSGGSGGRLKSHALSALVGAIAMAAIVGGLWYAGFAPSGPTAIAPGAATPQSGLADGVATRLDKIESAIKAQRPTPVPGERLDAQAQTKSLSDTVAALSRRVDNIDAAAQIAQKQADAAADAAKSAGQSSAQRSDLDALTGRVAALESAVKALSDNAAQPAASTDDRAARSTIAAEALRAVVERGAPYQAELAAVKALGAEENLIAPLEPFAATGVPSVAALARELAALTPALRQTSDAAPGGATFLGRLESNAQRLVRITPLDAPTGNDPATVLARLDVDAAHGDIGAALSDIAALPEVARSRAADWVKEAQARTAAIAASRQIAADALAALGKPASQ